MNYYTPEWQGWQAGIGYSFDADAQGKFRTNANNRALSLGLKYEDGPLLAVATWDQMRLAQPPQGIQGRPRALQLGASYDFEVLKVSAAWSRQRNGYVGLDGGDPDNLGQNSSRRRRGRRHGQRLAAWRERAAWARHRAGPMVAGQAGLAMGRWHDRAQGAADDAGVYLRAVEAHHGLHSPAMRRTTRWTTSSTPAIPYTTRYAMGVTHRF